MNADAAAAHSLLNAHAVRERAHRLLVLGVAGKLRHFRVDLGRLERAVDLVVETTKRAYPSLDVPFHSRWRHFVIDGEDRWAVVERRQHWRDAAARARAAFDLAIVSVLLDAGAGPQWRYEDAGSGRSIGRSEGLALASLAMFCNGEFSSTPGEPLRADATALSSLTDETLRKGFQVSPTNPLIGLEGRADLLRRLGAVVAQHGGVFGGDGEPRPGRLFDHLLSLSPGCKVAAPTLLTQLLVQFGAIWPSRLTLGGTPLGDCWRHPLVTAPDATNQLVPLHKLSQWLAYSLIEPLQWAGVAVTGIEQLTGLAEYRNGGLFIDTGVLAFVDPADAARAHAVDSIVVVEWRALTVALLDRLAEAMRRRLHMDEQALPLAKILQGGTWAAGRMIARQRRPDGAPPVKVTGDGTVF